jgi:hypothetical protein
VAGVKTQKGGPSKAPRWTPRDCYICELRIELGKDGVMVRRFYYPDGRKTELTGYAHRNCLK